MRNMNPEKAAGLSPELRHALEPLLARIESLSERIPEGNEGIEKLAQESYPRAARLKQIALTLILTLEDAHRFRKSRTSAAIWDCNRDELTWRYVINCKAVRVSGHSGAE